ncbi:MAG: MotA/TolQ/ExbB proton channel family protein [Deltaproteobacteria bacterium]|nr:MotA/TolQ/ExbB proton channel family protein [Deltaproteobacteria bacterium]
MTLSTLISTLLHQGGPVMPVLLGAVVAGYLLAVERMLVWSWWRLSDRELYCAPDARALRTALADVHRARGGLRVWGALLGFGAERTTPLASLLRAALALAALPPAHREQELQAEVLAQMPLVEARIATLGWLGGILPMLGLLGTVSGMVATFGDLAVTTSRQVLSQGLAEALWTTEVGLLGALPLLAVHHVLTRWRTRWLYQLERGTALLLGPPPQDIAASGGEGSHAV